MDISCDCIYNTSIAFLRRPFEKKKRRQMYSYIVPQEKSEKFICCAVREKMEQKLQQQLSFCHFYFLSSTRKARVFHARSGICAIFRKKKRLIEGCHSFLTADGGNIFCLRLEKGTLINTIAARKLGAPVFSVKRAGETGLQRRQQQQRRPCVKAVRPRPSVYRQHAPTAQKDF